MQRKALVTGISGQDGSYLADFLLEKGYEVHGMRLYDAVDDTARFSHYMNNPHFHLHHGDLTDAGGLWRLLSEVRPDEVYNLGAQSHVKVSFATPEATGNINALGPLRMLDALRGLGLKDTRYYQASSSEMFGNAAAPQSEDTPFQPCSPYGTAKVYAYWITKNYRESYGMHASNGILFNHESPLRGEEFVTRKISLAVAKISLGLQDKLTMGNLDARRDWGDARDYVEGMWLMLQQDTPGDYVLATGEVHSVREFIEAAFSKVNITIKWQGEGLDEIGIDSKTGRTLITIDASLFRPNEVNELIGDATRARFRLGWKPKTSFKKLVHDMVHADLRTLTEWQDNHDQHLRAAE